MLTLLDPLQWMITRDRQRESRLAPPEQVQLKALSRMQRYRQTIIESRLLIWRLLTSVNPEPGNRYALLSPGHRTAMSKRKRMRQGVLQSRLS